MNDGLFRPLNKYYSDAVNSSMTAWMLSRHPPHTVPGACLRLYILQGFGPGIHGIFNHADCDIITKANCFV